MRDPSRRAGYVGRRYCPSMLGDDALFGARRVLIYGVTGSGKTTLAEKLSSVTSLPWYSVDDMTWEPGWVEVANDEQRRRISEICARPEWILDTAYGRWREIPLSRAQLIVALDYPRWVSLQRLLRRTAARCWDRTPICNGNTESPQGRLRTGRPRRVRGGRRIGRGTGGQPQCRGDR